MGLPEVMSCEACGATMDATHLYCHHCGHPAPTNGKKRPQKDKLIFAFALIWARSAFWWLLLFLLAEPLGYEIYDRLYFISISMNISVVASIFLLIPIVKKGRLRTAVLIFAIVFAAIRLFWFIRDLYFYFQPEEIFYDF